MNRVQGAYSLSNIYTRLSTNSNRSNGKQSKSCDITRSRSQSDDGSLDKPKRNLWMNEIGHRFKMSSERKEYLHETILRTIEICKSLAKRC